MPAVAAIQLPHVAPNIMWFVYPEGEKLKSGTAKKQRSAGRDKGGRG